MNYNSGQALQFLMEGNKRYIAGKPKYPHHAVARRLEVAKGQMPFAIVLGCADSRVPPELIFDQGLGDLFVIRVAGNVSDPLVLGSIEFAVEEFHSPLIVVLGHSKCGAVTATVKGGDAPGQVASIVKLVEPAVQKVRGQAGDLVDNAVRANARLVAAQLQSSSERLAREVHEARLKIVAACYGLESGAVELLG